MTYIPIIAEAGLSEMSGASAFGFMLVILAMWFLIPTATIQGPSYSAMTYLQPSILIIAVVAAILILRKRNVRIWIRVPVIIALYAALTFGTNVFAFKIGHNRAFVSHVRSDCIRLLADAKSPAELSLLLNDTNQFGNEIGVFREFNGGDWIAILPRSGHDTFSIGAYYTVTRDSSGAWFESREMSPYNGIATITNSHGYHRRPEGKTLEAVHAELLRQGFTRIEEDANKMPGHIP